MTAPLDYTAILGAKPGENWQSYGSWSSGTENLSPQTILARMGDPKDAKRKRDIDALAAKAQAGDQAALARLEGLADFSRHDKVGAATGDAVNYARYVTSSLTGMPVKYVPPSDGQGFKNAVSTVLKVAAPVAGALIPGVGLLGAAAIGGLGNAAGQYVGSGKINVGQSLLAGGMAAGGNALLGNGLGSGGTGAFGSTPAGVAGTGPAGTGWGGSATMGGNAPAALGSGAQAAASSGGLGGLLNTAGNLAAKYGPLVLGGIGAVGAGKLGSQAEDLRNQAARVAMQDYQQRAPLREAAVTGLTGPRPQREDLSGLYADPSNPYRRPVARMGG